MKTSLILFCGLVLLTGACSRSPESLVREGIRELEEDNTSAALKDFKSALEDLEGHPDVAVVWNAVGVAAWETGREEEAEAAFLTATDLDPLLASAHMNLGVLYQRQGRTDEAFSSFSRASQADKSQSQALEMLAVDALRVGNQDEALSFLRQATGRNETAQTLSSLAVLSAEEYSLEERRDLLQRAVSLDPQYAPAQLNLAALLDQHRLDPEQAQAHYEAFIRLDPNSALVPQAVQRAQVMESRVLSGNIRRPDPVREDVERILQEAAQAEDVLIALRLCLQAHAVASRASRLDLRERALRAATTLAPESARAHVGLARFLREQGKNKEALTSFSEAHELAPQWPPAFSGAVILAVEQGNMELAKTLTTQTLDVVGNQPDALLIVADLYAGPLESPRKARDLYRKIRSDFPDSEAAGTAASRLLE